MFKIQVNKSRSIIVLTIGREEHSRLITSDIRHIEYEVRYAIGQMLNHFVEQSEEFWDTNYEIIKTLCANAIMDKGGNI